MSHFLTHFISPFSLTWPVILSRCKNNFLGESYILIEIKGKLCLSSYLLISSLFNLARQFTSVYTIANHRERSSVTRCRLNNVTVRQINDSP